MTYFKLKILKSKNTTKKLNSGSVVDWSVDLLNALSYVGPFLIKYHLVYRLSTYLRLFLINFTKMSFLRMSATFYGLLVKFFLPMTGELLAA